MNQLSHFQMLALVLLTITFFTAQESSCFAQQAAKRYALVVGVREYPASEKLPRLPYTESDASTLAETLARGGYEVTLMTKKASTGEGNERFNPNCSFIRKQFSDLVGTPFLNPQDCMVVVLEGHGIQLPSKLKAGKSTFYFCPSDAEIDNLKFSEDVADRHNLIPVQELYDTLKKSSAGVKLLIADACRNDPNRPDIFRSANSVTRPPLPTPPGGIAGFFSCSANQRAVEDPDLKHGVFSYYLIEGLSGKADTNNDQLITIGELQVYVGERVYNFVRKKYSRQQLPELSGEIKGFAPVLSLKPNANPPTTPPANNLKSFAGTRPGQQWSNNSLSMKFQWCPPGKFRMGSPESERNHFSDEKQVDVTLTHGFWIGTYELTQSQWESVMDTTVEELAAGGSLEVAGKGDQFPMHCMTWGEAMEFCRKFTQRERAAGRIPNDWEFVLPTEAQWEYACRAGTTTATSFGTRLGGADANIDGKYPYNGAAEGPALRKSVAVGSYKPNAWGIFDMHGNVWEFCQDWHINELPGGSDPVTLDKDKGNGSRAGRGGSWYLGGEYARSANRNFYIPDQRYNFVGMRVVLIKSSAVDARLKDQ